VNPYYRPRLSIDISEDAMMRLNKLLGSWRIKNALYASITDDLINLLEKIDPHQRILLISAIVEHKIELLEWCKTAQAVGDKNATPRP